MFSELEAASAKIDMADRRVDAGRCLTVLASWIEIKEVTMGIRWCGEGAGRDLVLDRVLDAGLQVSSVDLLAGVTSPLN